MENFLDDLKKDWEAFLEKGKEEDSQTDQMYDYTNTASPDQILIESMTAQPAAEKAMKEAMEKGQK